ncbi:hypothetical protein H5410_056749 [Solanum commersonii]|uniref:Pentatricopeptide repeat-containing protein n=1 Tax=Solanum commersonii TaxID=4109 RepID=A0A9J5WN49_SOLCO|nr:hypothetical protein H5410_056749 [Solanum commersonii]
MYSATCLTLDNGSDCDLVERLFRTMHKRNVVAWNTMFSWCNYVGNSFNVFNGMKERDIVSWKTMVFALVQNELDNKALMLVYEMKKLWVAIDDITITILLFAASNLRDREIGKQTHAYLLRHNIQFEGMESNLIDMYAKSKMIREEQAIFQWNVMIAGNTQTGLIEQSFVVFKEMLEQNVKPNDVTLASILPSCSQSGSISIGKQLHCFAIDNLFENNVYVVSALVDILEPNVVTFVAVLSTCNYIGLVDSGIQIFELMGEEYGIQPLEEHYACVVDMLGRVGRLDEAHNFAKTFGVESNVLGIWGSLFEAYRLHRNF